MSSERQNRAMRLITILFLTFLALMTGGLSASAEGDSQPAEDFIRRCNVAASKKKGDYAILWNNEYEAAFSVTGEGEQHLQIDLAGNAAEGLYIRWSMNPPQWRLEATLSDGSVVSSQQGTFGYVQEYVQLPKDTVSFRMVTDDGKSRPLSMVELEVYSPGVLPASVHKWQPTPSTAEMLVLSTHQDDEILYFGGTIPYYSGELGYDTVVAYAAYDNDLRLHEAMEGLWTCGLRQHPVFMGYKDKFCSTIDRARTIWNETEVIRGVTELIVRYRPQVIVSHDINGEYGHGQHLLLVHCLRNALVYAGDSSYVEKNLPGCSPWTVSKCYLHLYWKNRIVMQWGDMKLESAGGKTALEVARRAYDCHVSQHIFDYVVGTTDKTFDCRKFGLYMTNVGEDVSKNDFFENITLRYTGTEEPQEVYSWMRRTERNGWHYQVDAEGWSSGSQYVRYCTVNGKTGWYSSDITGSLTEPITQVDMVLDDNSLDVTQYETLTLVNSSPRVFNYNNGMLIKDLPVRYCAVQGGEPSFYIVSGSDGRLVEPVTAVHVSPTAMGDMELPELELKMSGGCSGGSGKTAILILCALLVLTAFALSVSVVRLMAINKSRRRAAARRPQTRGRRRYY
ncbi:MAG: hypothetical protein E7554_00355 [Ruminococcaceae bacterium]|nr:hypothetical protein [Oscillospiraceae bacterium]